jgi:hypothetical protein
MNPVKRAWRVFRKQGMRAVVRKALDRLNRRGGTFHSLVRAEDVLAVDWRTPHRWQTEPRELGDGPWTVAWIMSPPGVNSGGHQNIFRFIAFLERAGHHVRIYIDSTVEALTVSEVRERVSSSSSYTDLDATIEEFPRDGIPDDVDAIVATGWETAYLSRRDQSNARRFYFVQDLESLFYPASTDAVLAENTYRFGFVGLTAGNWLATRLRDEFGMSTSPFEFGADTSNYRVTEKGRRNAVFFYARPGTPRRGFELGQLVVRDRPDTQVILAGQPLPPDAVSFPHENPGNVQVRDLSALYNRCAAGLVLSLTNMSLLPLELLAAGVIPVVNDAPNNRMVSSNPFIAYVQPSPRALADAIIAALDRPDQPEYAVAAAESLAGHTWEESGAQFLAAFEGGMRG